jgi:hypothetical protein
VSALLQQHSHLAPAFKAGHCRAVHTQLATRSGYQSHAQYGGSQPFSPFGYHSAPVARGWGKESKSGPHDGLGPDISHINYISIYQCLDGFRKKVTNP